VAGPHRSQDMPAFAKHGQLRGLSSNRSHPLAGPESIAFEGRYGRMFGQLPPARFTEDDFPIFKKLAEQMTAAAGDPPQPDTEDNPGVSAGYTYLGQFITHDITFDPATSFQRKLDPDEILDYRTPRFDLDCLYGRGPADQPYLYRDDGIRLILGKSLDANRHNKNPRDLPRNRPEGHERARAVIGDPRNDENVIVSQMHAAMMGFHNLMADTLGADFDQVQQQVQWHYQWVVLNDFLPTVIGERTWKSIFPHRAKKTTLEEDPPELEFYNWRNEGYMPVEFSVAAYRFGHSMVRPVYQLNTDVQRPLSDLMGVGAVPSPWAIDWTLYFETGGAPVQRVQRAYKIDTSLVDVLGHLPKTVVTGLPSLAERDLRRSFQFSLPSGERVAAAMGERPIAENHLKIGKATKADTPHNPRLVDISPIFKDNTPLWVYVLAEAQQQFKTDATPIHLGPVGGRIVGEVIVGLMLADSESFLNQAPNFQPLEEFRRDGKFGMAELLFQVMQRKGQP
jgi:hypothetical protein